MLLEFRLKNFKTFVDETVFSMAPAPKIQDIKYSVLKQTIANKECKGLSSAVIYGPNAAGKTSIISAMEVLKSIVLSGNINNGNNVLNTPNETVRRLDLIPNSKCTTASATEFRIKFTENNFLFEYGLQIDFGRFLEENYDRKILSEQLFVNGKMIFNRGNTVEIGDVSVIKEHLINDFNRSVSEKMSKSNSDVKELFLTNMFKSVFSKELSDIIVKWFKEKFVCIYQSNRMAIGITSAHEKSENIAIISNTLGDAIKHFGINTNDIVYIASKDTERAVPHSMVQMPSEKFAAIPIEIYESYGTERFLNVFPFILKALNTGATLVIDEFDASIHPMAIMSIIGAFHNDEINKNNAQLIFNTHNPIFLNKNLFRRDEIKFIDRDDETGHSTHYSLSDFKTSGPHGVRNTDDYMKNYFVNQYGSIKNVDFSEVLRNYTLKISEEEV